MIDGDQDEQDDVAGGREAVEAGLVLLVDHRRDDVGGEAGAAARHRPDQVEGAQAADQADRMITVTVAGRDQRQRDVPEILPARWRRRSSRPRNIPAGSRRCRPCR